VSAQEDAADVARVLAGEVSAFEPIVRRWQKPLVNLAYRFCRDRAEDSATLLVPIVWELARDAVFDLALRARDELISIGNQTVAAVDVAAR
jgi:hypothetical protein